MVRSTFMKKFTFFVLLYWLFSLGQVFSQNVCAPPEIVFNRDAKNIFSEQQEMFLGDVIAENIEKNFRVITDEDANKYLREIGEKLVKHLPPTNLRFQFYLIDSPELNAFITPGGRIYVTRKLVAFVRNEAELAGILGHELGHGIVRHGSIDFSKYFKEILGVDRVGDREDVFQKYNEFIDKQNTKRVKTSQSHEGNQQLEADNIGVFSMIAAGYHPEAFSSAWDRLAETEGKTGSSFSEFFGTTRPGEKRLREILKAIKTIPAECLDKLGSDSDANFSKWQSYVVTTTSFPKEEKLPALLTKKSLEPYLRGDIKHFRFSPDGKYVLAQDASGINVLKTEPFSFAFRIDADDAKFASFSPDSKFVTLQTFGLRVEKWSVAEKKAVLAQEVYVRESCWQSTLSPDGETLVCYSGAANLDIIDVRSNQRIYRKKEFYVPSFLEYLTWTFSLSNADDSEIDAIQMEFSPDGKYFLGGRVYRFNVFGSFFNTNLNQSSFIAFDIRDKKEIKVEGEIKNIISMPYAFYSNDAIIGQHRSDPEKSGIFTFPEGKRIEKFYLNASSYTKAHKGDFLLVRPTANFPVGVYDLKAKKFVASNKTPALDVYGELSISESKDGVISLFKPTKDGKGMEEVAFLELPKNNLGDIKTISVSPDFNWLAVSEKSRGAIWNIPSGEMKIYIRGFRGSYFDENGVMFADFPKFEAEPRAIGTVNPANSQAAIIGPIETRNTKQVSKYLVRLQTKADERAEKQREKQKGKGEYVPENDDEKQKPKVTFTDGLLTGFNSSGSREDGTLEIYDARNRKLLWTKEFPNEIPRYEIDEASKTVSFYWVVSTKTAREIIKNSPKLSESLKSLGDKDGDYLVQILNADTGNVVGETLVETGEGSFRIVRAFASGDWLTIIDSENRVQLYSMSKGTLVWRFFGDNVSLNPLKGLAAIENVAGQISVYRLSDGKKIDELQFPTSVVYAEFSSDGKKLFVLTATQNYYLFDAEKFGLKNG